MSSSELTITDRPQDNGFILHQSDHRARAEDLLQERREGKRRDENGQRREDERGGQKSKEDEMGRGGAAKRATKQANNYGLLHTFLDYSP